jgi:hypothetical protein
MHPATPGGNAQQRRYPDLSSDKLKYDCAGKQTYAREPEALGDSRILEKYGGIPRLSEEQETVAEGRDENCPLRACNFPKPRSP